MLGARLNLCAARASEGGGGMPRAAAPSCTSCRRHQYSPPVITTRTCARTRNTAAIFDIPTAISAATGVSSRAEHLSAPRARLLASAFLLYVVTVLHHTYHYDLKTLLRAGMEEENKQ